LAWDFHRELARLDDGFGLRRSSSSEISPLRAWGFRRAVLETEAVVSGFENVAAVGDMVEQRGRHLCVAEHGSPSPKLRLVVMMTLAHS
jgi:hypothetical protein